MKYADKDIKKYLSIIDEYKNRGSKTKSCDSKNFIEYQGQYLCLCCSQIKGKILGNIEPKDYNRIHYQKKSIYHRKYYFIKKVDIIAKKIDLTDYEKNLLYDNLILLDVNEIKIINKKFGRKRMININFIIKKILEKFNYKKAEKINLKFNDVIKDKYEEIWKEYKNIKNIIL